MQKPDTKPGAYYVSVTDGPRRALLAGPFINDHVSALAMVDKTRAVACELDVRGQWYAFGTCRLDNNDRVPLRYGKLNAQLGLPS